MVKPEWYEGMTFEEVLQGMAQHWDFWKPGGVIPVPDGFMEWWAARDQRSDPAVLAERERCAKICEEAAERRRRDPTGLHDFEVLEIAAHEIRHGSL